MKRLHDKIESWRPHFSPGGRLSALGSVYDGFATFLFTPTTTAAPVNASHIHDAIDSKRIMITVVLALMPCFFFGMYNTGYQHWLAAGATSFPFWSLMLYGFMAILPKVVVTYFVGLGIEFAFAQWRKEDIQEGFLVTGILIPMICPVETPLWMMAVATAFAVVFAKEVFGGTGYNIVNIALIARAFLFFAYPAKMSGDEVFVATQPILGFGPTVPDGFTCATPLGQIASSNGPVEMLTTTGGHSLSLWDAFLGLMPGSFGETSLLCILIGAVVLLASGIGNWRIMLSVALGALFTGWITNTFATPLYPASYLLPWEQFLYGGLAFAAVFMATDPVTACRTHTGQWIYGALIGIVAVIIRTYNNGYPEGAMLAVLLMNVFASFIDWWVVRANINRRRARAQAKIVNQ